MNRKKFSIYYLSLVIVLVFTGYTSFPRSLQSGKYFLILDYIEYNKALEFLDRKIKEFKEDLETDSENDSIYKGLLSLFRMTKKKIIEYFQKERP
jgi:hypothetical protein